MTREREANIHLLWERPGQPEPHPRSDSKHLRACNMKSGARFHLLM